MNIYSPAFSFNRTRVRTFGSGGGFIRSNEPLTPEQIMQAAPSVYAEGKHNSRSERYSFIPTGDVLAGLAREGFHPFSVKQGGSRDAEKRNFTKHMIRLRHEGNAAPVVGGDSVPEIVLINSHDGTSSYNLMYGFFRLVCSNGLIIADNAKGPATSFKIGHTGDIVGKVIEGCYSVISEGQAQIERVERLRGIALTENEQAAFVEAALPLRFDSENMPAIAPRDVLRARRTDDVGADLWRVFNRTQERLVNGGLRYTQRDENGRRVASRTSRPVNGVDGDVKINRQLWALAERMAELKAA
jgi:hypothetical protein